MAGLPLFGETFRNWMSGSTATAPRQTTADAKVHVSMSNKTLAEALQNPNPSTVESYPRLRQPGIRMYTDESCDLPKSNEIMQHLAVTRHGSSVQNVGTDSRSLASLGSTTTTEIHPDGHEAIRYAYENIEAEIDQLKEDVMRLRDQADHGRTTPKTEQDLTNDKLFSVRNGRQHSITNDTDPESAAARLQRQHEAEKSAASIAQDQSIMQQSLSPHDFPALNCSTPCSREVYSNTSELQQRKLSYRDAITNSTSYAKYPAFPATIAKRRDTQMSDSTTAATQKASENREDQEHSVIISRRFLDMESSANKPASTSKGQHSVDSKPAKQSPRFAQPTQSFSRRTGETVRAGTSPVSAKSSPTGSPTKASTPKEPNLATDKRATQRRQKRKSLPSNWLGTVSQQPKGTLQDGFAKPAKTAVTPEKIARHDSALSPFFAESWQVSEGRHTKENATMMPMKPKQAEEQSPVRRKKYSYMASTNAATQRTLATLGEDKAKREPQPQRKPAASHSKAEMQTQHSSTLQRSTTLSSEGSSVQFILDQTISTPGPSLKPLSTNLEGNSEKHRPRPVRSRAPTSVSSQLDTVSGNPDQSSSTATFNTPSNVKDRMQHSTQSGLSVITDSEVFGALPEVANTTKQRRISRGHLLTPIVACLDAKGLLNQTSTNNAVIESYLKTMSPRSSLNAQNTMSKRTSDSANRLSEGISSASQQIPVRDVSQNALAPHLRKMRAVGHSKGPSDTIPSSNLRLPSKVPNQCENTVTDSTLHRETPAAVVGQSFEAARGASFGQTSRVSSLRATANEFKPAKSSIEDFNYFDLQAVLQYVPDEQWHDMGREKREAVRNLRHLFSERGSQLGRGMPRQRSPPRAPLKSATHLWTNEMPQGQMHDQTFKSVNENGSPYGVQVGQILKPSLSPGKKTVRWTLQDVDGKQTPIKFGRAPPPTVTPVFDPSTPTISPISHDTTPLKTSHSLRGWQIGSAVSPIPYGWTGGDGKEIKFVGYGPHAERDPNSAVNFSFYGRTGRYTGCVPNGFNEDKENQLSDAHVAPKSQRQWAEKYGYERVPCGNVEITHAVEHCIPFGSQLAGYCHDCMASK